jgi:hypothetical protein
LVFCLGANSKYLENVFLKIYIWSRCQLVVIRKFILIAIILFLITINFPLKVETAIAHPVFTDPFTLNYTSHFETFNPELITINYNSETRILKANVQSGNNSIAKEVILTENQDHELRDMIGGNNVLDLNFTDSYCSDPQLCELSTLEINTPRRSVKLTWTSYSANSLQVLNGLDNYIHLLSNTTRGQ